MHKVSIIIPAYNVATFLPRCLESVFKQTYSNLEVLVIDDGSKDDTLAIAQQIAKSDSRCIVIHQPNAGLSGARNTGIDNSTGDFLFFLDSDDFIGSQEIEQLVDRQSATQADMTIGGFTFTDPEGQPLSRICAPSELLDEEQFWDRAMGHADSVEFIVAWGKLYKRELFSHERFDMGRLHEDEYIIHRLAAQCSRIATAAIDDYYYVQNPQSITHAKTVVNYLDASEALLKRIDYLTDKHWFAPAWEALSIAKAPLSEAQYASDPDPAINQKRLKYLKDCWDARYDYLTSSFKPSRSFKNILATNLFRHAPNLFTSIKKAIH